jgi:hypothetical protein
MNENENENENERKDENGNVGEDVQRGCDVHSIRKHQSLSQSEDFLCLDFTVDLDIAIDEQGTFCYREFLILLFMHIYYEEKHDHGTCFMEILLSYFLAFFFY